LGGITIVIVEDQTLVSSIERSMLERHGFSVVTLETGCSAIQYLQENHPANLILMDISLEDDMDGIECAARILKTRDIPVVFVSSHDDATTLEQLERVSYYGYVLKNAGEAVLVASIRMALRQFESKQQEYTKDAQYRLLFENMTQGLVYHNPDGSIAAANSAAARILGLTQDQLMARNLLAPNWQALTEDGRVLHGPDHPAMVAFRTGKVVRQFEMGVHVPQRDTHVWLSVNAVPLYALGSTSPTLVAVTMEDISERKIAGQALKAAYNEKSLLLKELQHRVKNSFALITSMIQLAGNTTGSAEAQKVVTDILNRVNAISELYTLLYATNSVSSVPASTYFSHLIDSLVAMSGNVGVHTELAELPIPIKNATSLGIIITELVTNTLKYAFPDDRAGTLHVSFAQDGPEQMLRVRDDGIGYPPQFSLDHASGLGITLVKALTEQLHGTFTIEHGPGAACTVRYPAPVENPAENSVQI